MTHETHSIDNFDKFEFATIQYVQMYSNGYSICVHPLYVLENGGVSEYYTEYYLVAWTYL